ncbi:MAG: hypothetical protein ACK41W_01805 [Cyanobacteriota bacterium]|jgi:hypothetical protein
MCFSATASFLASGVLVAVGSATWAIARDKGDRPRLPLALAPLLFGVQQALEGLVWLGIEAHGRHPGEASPTTVAATLAYLFFAYAFWPVWMPWTAVSLLRRFGEGAGLWSWLPGLGLVPGLLLWLPLLGQPQSALPTSIGHALVYPLNPWTAQLLPALVGPVLYAALIVVPLLRVPSGRVRAFALTLLLAFTLTEWASRQALTSLWCYASALLSAQILWILWERAPGEANQPTAAGEPQPQA